MDFIHSHKQYLLVTIISLFMVFKTFLGARTSQIFRPRQNRETQQEEARKILINNEFQKNICQNNQFSNLSFDSPEKKIFTQSSTEQNYTNTNYSKHFKVETKQQYNYYDYLFPNKSYQSYSQRNYVSQLDHQNMHKFECINRLELNIPRSHLITSMQIEAQNTCQSNPIENMRQNIQIKQQKKKLNQKIKYLKMKYESKNKQKILCSKSRIKLNSIRKLKKIKKTQKNKPKYLTFMKNTQFKKSKIQQLKNGSNNKTKNISKR